MAEGVAYQLRIVDHVHHLQDGNTDAHEFVVDSLADLMHFARGAGVQFEQALETASHHFRCEVAEEDEDD